MAAPVARTLRIKPGPRRAPAPAPAAGLARGASRKKSFFQKRPKSLNQNRRGSCRPARFFLFLFSFSFFWVARGRNEGEGREKRLARGSCATARARGRGGRRRALRRPPLPPGAAEGVCEPAAGRHRRRRTGRARGEGRIFGGGSRGREARATREPCSAAEVRARCAARCDRAGHGGVGRTREGRGGGRAKRAARIGVCMRVVHECARA